MFKMVCATPTVHQNAIFWPKSWFCGPKKGFLPILTPKSALCPKFLLPHGISGYLLRRIWWRLFLSRKKSPEDFINCYVCPKFRFWSHFGPLDLFFTKIAPKYPHMMMIGHVVGPHWYIYRVPGLSNMPIVTIFLTQLAKDGLKWAQFAKIMIFVWNWFFSQIFQFRFWSCFGPLNQFSPKLPPNYPKIRTGHIVGTHRC